MKNTVVLALEAGDRSMELAKALEADHIEYSDDAFPLVFRNYRRIVAIMSIGIVVRKIAPLLNDKWTDPAVVVISPNYKYAVPVLGGHHGANDLAKELAPLGMVPVITTATESFGLESVEVIASRLNVDVVNRDSTREVNAAILKSPITLYSVTGPGMVLVGPGVSVLLRKGEYVVGVGCRKGVSAEEVRSALVAALEEAGIQKEEVFVYATTEKKVSEVGLIRAVEQLGGNLVFVDDNSINSQAVETPSKAQLIGLLGVAEPAALAVSKRHEMIMERKVYGNVTVAIAR